MSAPNVPEIIETPNHFWFGATDLAFAVGGKEGTKVKPFGDDYVLVTKTFLAKSYKYDTSDSPYVFKKPTTNEKPDKKPGN